ncbi:hypothetical protein [Salana multivorans]
MGSEVELGEGGVAGNALLPALARAPEGSIQLADGYSFRTRAEQLAGVRGRSLAQVLMAQ